MFNSFQMIGGSAIRAPRRIEILRDVSFNMVQAYDFNTTTLINGNYYVKNYLNDGLTGNLRTSNRTTTYNPFPGAGTGCLLLNTEPIFDKIYYTTDVGTTITFRFSITTNDYYATTIGGSQLNAQVDAQVSLNFYLRCNNNLAFYPYTALYVAARNTNEYMNRRYLIQSDNYKTSPYAAATGTIDGNYACMMMQTYTWCFVAITFGRQKNGTMDNKTMLLFSDVNSDPSNRVNVPPPSSVGISNISTTNAAGITCSETFLNGTQISCGLDPTTNVETRFTDRVIRRGGVSFTDNRFGIDDFRVYNRALTVDELKFEYNHTYTA